MNDGLLLFILVFMSNCDVCVLKKKYKKIFSCVLNTANTLTCFRTFFMYKNIGSFKNVFSHGFLKHQKNCFLAFLDFTTCL
jgi:hypothetical protein